MDEKLGGALFFPRELAVVTLSLAGLSVRVVQDCRRGKSLSTETSRKHPGGS